MANKIYPIALLLVVAMLFGSTKSYDILTKNGQLFHRYGDFEN